MTTAQAAHISQPTQPVRLETRAADTEQTETQKTNNQTNRAAALEFLRLLRQSATGSRE